MFERLLEDFQVQTISNDAITLINNHGYTYKLSLASAFPPTLHTTLTGPERPLPPQSNLIKDPEQFKVPLPQSLRHDEKTKTITFKLADGKKVALDYSSDVHLQVTESLINEDGEQDDERLVFGTVPRRGYLLGEHGMIRYTRLIEGNLHVGMGEKGAPLGERDQDLRWGLVPNEYGLQILRVGCSSLRGRTQQPTMRTLRTL